MAELFWQRTFKDDFNLSVKQRRAVVKWAAYTMQDFKKELRNQRVYRTGALRNSLQHNVRGRGGRTDIVFEHLIHGMFVDQGWAGKMSKDPRHWYSSPMMKNQMRLAQIMMNITGSTAKMLIESKLPDKIKL